VETTLQDIRYGLRMLRKNLGFTSTALLALTLGIASTTAIFSVIDGVLLHPLPYPDADKIVLISQTERSTGASTHDASPANYLDWLSQNDVFSDMAAARGWQSNLTDGDRPERVRSTMATTSLFPLFGIQPILGRTLIPSDQLAGNDHVVVVSHALWQRRYGSDRAVIGREIRLDGQPYTVVGVMPASFSPDGYGELWVPSPFGVPTHPLTPEKDPRQRRDSNYLDVFARLKPGVSLERARTEMNAIALRLEQQYPADNKDVGVAVIPLHDDMVSNVRPVLLVLFAAVAFLLLIGCANVANLLLARAATRAKEVSIRAALGASRARLIRQLLTESVLLALIGGTFGILLALWAVPLLLAIGPAGLTSFHEIALNRNVLAFSLGASVFTGVLFGIVPALHASAANPGESLRAGERGSTVSATRGRSILIATEVGMSLVLLIGAGLMIRSFAKLTQVDPGFSPDHLLVFNIGLPASADLAKQATFCERVLERLRTLPGVQSAGAVSRLPLSGGNSNRTFNIPGSDTEFSADIRVATSDYFRALRIPLIRGRTFTDRDIKGAAPVAVVNEAMARAVFPGEDPIGKFVLNFGPGIDRVQIAGVVGDVRHLSLETAPRPEIYVPLGQAQWPSVFVAVRTETANPLTLTPAMQKAVWDIDKDVALANVRTMDDMIARSLLQRRFTMLLLAIFAGLALVLAAIGLYGVMSYSVSQRTREIGIRMALGARRADVLTLVVRQGMILTATGVIVGIVASFGLTRLMSSLLFGVSATDTFTFVSLSVLLLGVALLACWLPARRASSVNPMIALRAE
jgi:putative ABC transport system permease protein